MTWSGTATPTLSIGVFILLRDLIAERLGVWYDEDKRELLGGKLSDRIRELGLRSFLDYYYRLKYGLEAPSEWSFLTDLLSVQETYFWREMDQVRALVDVLIPKHVSEGRGPVRIWSAACASGEEPLTLAMALDQAGWFDRADIQIWATDVSQAALDRAARGLYRQRSFRTLPESVKAKYFSPVGNEWQVDPRLQSRVRYARVNLVDDSETAGLAFARYIFCRNVFIYFSNAMIGQVVGAIAQRMPRPGYLFHGVSESLLHLSEAFELRQIGDAFVYGTPGASGSG